MLTALTALWDDKETVREERQRAQRAAGRQTHSSWMGYVKLLHAPQWAADTGTCCRRWYCLWRGGVACVIHPAMDGHAARFLSVSCDLRNDLSSFGQPKLRPSTLAIKSCHQPPWCLYGTVASYGRTILQATYSLLSAHDSACWPTRQPAESTDRRDWRFFPPRRAFSCLNGNLISISDLPSLVEQWLICDKLPVGKRYRVLVITPLKVLGVTFSNSPLLFRLMWIIRIHFVAPSLPISLVFPMN